MTAQNPSQAAILARRKCGSSLLTCSGNRTVPVGRAGPRVGAVGQEADSAEKLLLPHTQEAGGKGAFWAIKGITTLRKEEQEMRTSRNTLRGK